MYHCFPTAQVQLLDEELGRGGFGVVKLAFVDGQPVAVKSVAVDTPYKADMLVREIDAHMATDDVEGILQLRGASLQKGGFEL